MRVIHVVPAVAEEASGPSYSVTRLCQSLKENGTDVALAALDWGVSSKQPEFLMTFPLGTGPRRLGRSPAMYRWLRMQCETQPPDVMHNHGMWQLNSVYPAWAVRRLGIQLICSPRGAFSLWAMKHGSSAKRVFWALLQRGALESATCFHATAETEYLDIRRLGFRQPVAVIPNGIDLPPLSERAQSAQRTLLFLGRIHEGKGIDLLLDAWSSVQDSYPDWQLNIVGNDNSYHGSDGYLFQIKRKASKLGLKRVNFLGAIYGPGKFQAFRGADLYVLPSYSENFAITVAEALAMETPAIVSKGAPWPGLCAKGAGWWIDIGVEPLVNCLKDALSRSPAVLAAMGRRGRAWMDDDFSWGSIGAHMTETYRWLSNRSLTVPSWVRLD